MSDRVLTDFSNGVPSGTVIHHHSQFEKLKSQSNAASGRMANQKKLAKNDQINLESYDLAVKFGKKDPAEAIETLNTAIYYIKTLFPATGTQLNFFDKMPAQADMEAELRERVWYGKGFTAGISAQPENSCPYPLNEPGGQAWLRGHRDGYAQIAEDVKTVEQESPAVAKIEAAPKPSEPAAPPAEATAEPEKAKRGRPPKAAKAAEEPKAAKPGKANKAEKSAESNVISPKGGWGAAGGVESHGPEIPPAPPVAASEEPDVPFGDEPPPPPDDAPKPMFVH
jgi:ribosome modulation factor